MNKTLPLPVSTELPSPVRGHLTAPSGQPCRTGNGLPWTDCAWVADWKGFLFVHYALPPEVLAPNVPYELDLFGGYAFVSLVFFTLDRMRLPFAAPFTRRLLRPISDHPFLNVRTYVREKDNQGICFLAEWVPNRISERLGPMIYGLPYRRGEFQSDLRHRDGIGHLSVKDHRCGEGLRVTYPLTCTADTLCEEDTSEAFLLERYRAYTFRGPTRRHFAVAHPPWQFRPADWIRADTTLVEAVFPWFRHAKFHSAHVSAGMNNVQMGFPHRISRS